MIRMRVGLQAITYLDEIQPEAIGSAEHIRTEINQQAFINQGSRTAAQAGTTQSTGLLAIRTAAKGLWKGIGRGCA